MQITWPLFGCLMRLDSSHALPEVKVGVQPDYQQSTIDNRLVFARTRLRSWGMRNRVYIADGYTAVSRRTFLGRWSVTLRAELARFPLPADNHLSWPGYTLRPARNGSFVCQSWRRLEWTGIARNAMYCSQLLGSTSLQLLFGERAWVREREREKERAVPYHRPINEQYGKPLYRFSKLSYQLNNNN